MRHHKKSLLLISILFVFGFIYCTNPSEYPSSDNVQQDTTVSYPPLFQQALQAHGGFSTWQQQKQLKFDVYAGDSLIDHQMIALGPRKTMVQNEQYQIGYNGKDVWVMPDRAAYSGPSARFYHSLQFYFFALPFVFADPGIQYKSLGKKDFQGTPYDVLQISYKQGVGDASQDQYLCYFDSQNHQLKLLLYTATYFSGKASQDFNARLYETWQKVDGLLVPEKVISYVWNDGTLGKERNVTYYKNVAFSDIAPDDSLFAAPESAYIDKQ